MSASQILWIPGRLPGLNELEQARGVKFRNNRSNGYNQLKRDSQQRIILLARSQLKPVKRALFSYEFHEPNRRRDPSNFVAGGVKLIEDALREAKILKNDGWKQIAGFSATWVLDRESQGVWIKMEAVDG